MQKWSKLWEFKYSLSAPTVTIVLHVVFVTTSVDVNPNSCAANVTLDLWLLKYSASPGSCLQTVFCSPPPAAGRAWNTTCAAGKWFIHINSDGHLTEKIKDNNRQATKLTDKLRHVAVPSLDYPQCVAKMYNVWLTNQKVASSSFHCIIVRKIEKKKINIDIFRTQKLTVEKRSLNWWYSDTKDNTRWAGNTTICFCRSLD